MRKEKEESKFLLYRRYKKIYIYVYIYIFFFFLIKNKKSFHAAARFPAIEGRKILLLSRDN